VTVGLSDPCRTRCRDAAARDHRHDGLDVDAGLDSDDIVDSVQIDDLDDSRFRLAIEDVFPLAEAVWFDHGMTAAAMAASRSAQGGGSPATRRHHSAKRASSADISAPERARGSTPDHPGTPRQYRAARR
jgi:hypothetical protein